MFELIVNLVSLICLQLLICVDMEAGYISLLLFVLCQLLTVLVLITVEFSVCCSGVIVCFCVKQLLDSSLFVYRVFVRI